MMMMMKTMKGLAYMMMLIDHAVINVTTLARKMFFFCIHKQFQFLFQILSLCTSVVVDTKADTCPKSFIAHVARILQTLDVLLNMLNHMTAVFSCVLAVRAVISFRLS